MLIHNNHVFDTLLNDFESRESVYMLLIHFIQHVVNKHVQENNYT